MINNSITDAKFKYKQIYRKAWEDIPEFRGWLKPVANQPNKAFCITCKKLLQAHRISLLKHTSTAKHQRIFEQKLNPSSSNIPKTKTFDLVSRYYTLKNSDLKENIFQKQNDCDKINMQIENDAEKEMYDNINDDNFEEDQIDLTQSINNDLNPLHLEYDSSGKIDENISDNQLEESETEEYIQKCTIDEENIPLSSDMTSPVSTHILDTSIGRPAANVQISFYKLDDEKWIHVSEGRTNQDGRLQNLIDKSEFTEGCYKIQFHVSEYFELNNISAFYPFIEIVFNITNSEEHYHVPLLLTPFGYSTYRGS